MNDRKEIAARIKALLAKTVDKGCTEEEAMAAAAKAKQLMDKYQIDLSEADLEAEGFVKGVAERAERRRFNVQNWIARAIAEYCDCKYWSTAKLEVDAKTGKVRRTSPIVFFGLRSDVEFANWLLKALEAFTWAQADRFGGNYYERRNFAMGCSQRISERLIEEAERRKQGDVTMATGTSLVVVKDKLVAREFDKLGLKLRKTYSSYTHGGSRNANAAGRAAGDRATFGRPVNGGRGTLSIGR